MDILIVGGLYLLAWVLGWRPGDDDEPPRHDDTLDPAHDHRLAG